MKGLGKRIEKNQTRKKLRHGGRAQGKRTKLASTLGGHWNNQDDVHPQVFLPEEEVRNIERDYEEGM